MRCLQHFRFGIALGNVAAREKDDKLLITAVSQINHGGPQAVIDGEQGVVVAMMNLDAGKKAMAMSDFFSAYSFFDHGISYLRRGHWDEHYDLTLELFNLAARCAFKNAEYASLKILTGQIMRKAKCFEDKCQAISISITLLLMSGNVPEAIKVIFDMLKNLGEELRRLITPAVIQHHLGETKSKLAGLSDDSLLCYPLMTKPSKKIAMDLLLDLFEAFSVTGEKASLPIIPLKMIQISLKHGMTALSPVGFAQYGNYLALVRGEFEEGYRYVKLALSLMKQMPSRAHDGDIICFSNHTRLLVEPMQSAVENYLEAYKAAMKNGATRNAMQCSFMYDVSSFWSGKKLDAVVESMKATMKQMKYHKNLVMLEIVLPLYRVALRLTGQSDTSPQQNQLTDVFGETRKEGDVGGKLTTLVLTAHFNGFYEALMFRDFEKARDSVEKFFAEQSQSTLTMSNPMFHRLL
jgi:predicted ATPase